MSAHDPGEAGSASQLLCGFGSNPQWTWSRVSSDPRTFERWLNAHAGKVKTLSFGNHRKFESKRPAILFRVVESFQEWVMDNGASPSEAFNRPANVSQQAWFDALFHGLSKNVYRFRRTGAFDFLCLLADLGLAEVRAGSCYLGGSTGPLAGAKKLWGERKPRELGRLADDLAKKLGITFEVVEDALCMWQKREKRKRRSLRPQADHP
jgi:Alpha-glutamyl/putrescinyl thymine pyrophosphorylase clade 3